MFPHELADPSVSFLPDSSSIWCLAKVDYRFAAFLYTPEGKVVTQRVWDETLAELDFAHVRHALDSMRA